jgi:hypothetical protein
MAQPGGLEFLLRLGLHGFVKSQIKNAATGGTALCILHQRSGFATAGHGVDDQVLIGLQNGLLLYRGLHGAKMRKKRANVSIG